MKNLTTRKIVLGMLMTLVLAFGVQGTADALTLSKSSGSDDLEIRAAGDSTDFVVRFSVKDLGTNETLPIPEPTGLTLKKIGNTVLPSGTSITMKETLDAGDASYQKLTNNRSYSVTYSVNSDASSGTVQGTLTPSSGTALGFTVYITPENNFTQALSLADSTVTGRTKFHGDDDTAINSHFSAGNHVRVRYKVNGGGSVYVKEAGRAGGPSTRDLVTSSSAPVYLDMKQKTNTVTVSVVGQPARLDKSVLYIYQYVTLRKISGDKQTGTVSSRLEDPFVVEVKDRNNTLVSGIDVSFAVRTTGAGSFLQDPIFPSDLYDASPPTSVKTNSSGRANIFLVLGATSTDDQGATVTIPAADTSTILANTETFEATARAATDPASITVVSGDGQRADSDGLIEDPLVVVVKDSRGKRLGSTETNKVAVRFFARDGGTLEEPGDNEPGTVDSDGNDTDTIIDVLTDSDGEASVRYTPPEAGGRRTVSASINQGAKFKIFTINGPASSGDDRADDREDDAGDREPVRNLAISVSGSGNTRDVTVTALQNGVSQSGISVNLSVSSGATLSHSSGGTPLESTLTLPTTAGTYTLRASTTAAGYSAVEEDVLVTLPGTLLLEELGARAANGGQSIRVTVREADNTLASGNVTVTLTGAVSRTILTEDGIGGGVITLPTTGGPHSVTLRATGYNTQSFTLSATGQQPPTGGQPTTGGQPIPTGSVGAADSIEIDGSRQLSGTVNQASRLRVRVVDANDRSVSGVKVTFKVLRPGQGRLSQRGNGRAVVAETDRSGYASATLTPLGGNLIVEAKAAGVAAPVSFIINVGAGSDTETDTGTGGTAETPSREINPAVHVGAAQRPPMLWVDGGAIYTLVGAEVERFAPSVDNALNLAVGGGKVYWTEQTGDRSGSINRANLDGSDVTELVKTAWSIPMGIAVDTANKHLYWTNSSGKIKRANLNAKQAQNVLQNLQSPMDIALSGGNIYWTQGNGSVRFVNLQGTKDVRNISTGMDTPMSLAIGGGKVYWTEKTGDSAGTVNSANLDGSGAKQLAESRWSVPMGIAVDTARSRLYWTNSSGKIKRASLNGRQGHNAVDGLGMPGDMVLSNSLTAPTAAKPTTPTPTDGSVYDVNGDGTVDNTDADLVVGALGTSDPKSDVNGDGTVNYVDLGLVLNNLDDGAAGAPAHLGMKMTTVEIDRLQEQIDLLIASGDRSPAAMRTLIYLQQLIATARPEKTQLLANYPNPFNPETWMPYELATDTNVKITIYNTQGVVIRTLELGHQSAGYYTGRDRAAYWDGRNALGEQVASGLYFYQFETDEMSSMRKMVILK